MNIYQRFRRLSFWNKLGFLGSVASVVSILIYFLFPGNDAGISLQGDVSHSNVFQVMGNLNIGRETQHVERERNDPVLPKWMVGKVVVPFKDQFAFQSTGFITIFNKRTFFITSLKLIRRVQELFGDGVEIFVQLPGVRQDLFRSRYLFAIKDEDSAVYAIDDLIQEGQFESTYIPPSQLAKGRDTIIMGYSNERYREMNPLVLPNTFLGRVSYDTKRDRMYLSPHIREDDSIYYISSGAITPLGVGGAPVIVYGTSTLIGMANKTGNDKKDARVYSTLGVHEFNMFVALDQTIIRIRALSQGQ